MRRDTETCHTVVSRKSWWGVESYLKWNVNRSARLKTVEVFLRGDSLRVRRSSVHDRQSSISHCELVDSQKWDQRREQRSWLSDAAVRTRLPANADLSCCWMFHSLLMHSASERPCKRWKTLCETYSNAGECVSSWNGAEKTTTNRQTTRCYMSWGCIVLWSVSSKSGTIASSASVDCWMSAHNTQLVSFDVVARSRLTKTLYGCSNVTNVRSAREGFMVLYV